MLSSLVHTFIKYPPQKALDWLKSDFIWNIYASREQKIYIIGPGHMTKIATMPIYGKDPLEIFFSRTISQMTLKLGKRDFSPTKFI